MRRSALFFSDETLMRFLEHLSQYFFTRRDLNSYPQSPQMHVKKHSDEQSFLLS